MMLALLAFLDQKFQKRRSLVSLVLGTIGVLVLVSGYADANDPNHLNLGIPYSEPDEQVFPTVAACITEISCSNASGGFVFFFKVLAFEECWKPIYSIHLDINGPNGVTAASCPAGWIAYDESGGHLMEQRSLIFSTETSPINPGESVGPFGICCEINHLTISWYPRDADGELLGKVTTENFSCATYSEPSTWGKVKALYR